MHRSFAVSAVLFVLAVATLCASCGGGDSGGAFENCGNGVIDKGEECDDGNLNDDDACLGTCRFNVCGDSFLNPAAEQCEAGILNGADCRSLGFASGTLACSPQCTFDTSGCSGQGSVGTPTPTSSAETTPASTGSSETSTPTAAPTPTGDVCRSGDQITVTVALDTTYGAARVDLSYPASLNIPGNGSGSDVKSRVVFTPTGGVTAVNDQDTNSDGSDDTLTASFAGTDDIAPGTFFTATFDCIAGSTVPSASGVTCTVISASTGGGTAIPDEQCSVTLATPP